MKRLIALAFLPPCVLGSTVVFGTVVGPVPPAPASISFPAQLASASGPSIWISNNATGKAQAAAASLTVTPAVTPTTNYLIIVPGNIGVASMTSVADNRGNTFRLDAMGNDATNGICAWVYSFKATATYNGTYNVVVTPTDPTNINASILIASGQATPAIDVSTNGIRTATFVSIGTTTITDATCGLWVSAFSDTSGVNDGITPRGNLIAIYEEEDGASWTAGAAAYSTTTTNSVTTKGDWILAASKASVVATATYK